MGGGGDRKRESTEYRGDRKEYGKTVERRAGVGQ